MGHQPIVQAAAGPLRGHTEVRAATGDDVVDDDLPRTWRRHGDEILIAQHQANAGSIIGCVSFGPEFAVFRTEDDVALYQRIDRVVEINAGVVVVVGNVVFQGDVSRATTGHQPFAVVVVDDVAASNAVFGKQECQCAAAHGVAADVDVAVTVEPGGGQVVGEGIEGDLIAVEVQRPRAGQSVIGDEVFVTERLPPQRQIGGEAHELPAVGRAVEGVDVGVRGQPHGACRPF